MIVNHSRNNSSSTVQALTLGLTIPIIRHSQRNWFHQRFKQSPLRDRRIRWWD